MIFDAMMLLPLPFSPPLPMPQLAAAASAAD
jgi:hypothetical protein